MQLTVFNGSPGKANSNSKVLMDEFVKGFSVVPSNEVRVFYLADIAHAEEHKEAFLNSEHVIFIFPLYTDAMPGIVKHFLEQIYSSPNQEGKHVGFIVQSGFPEAKHSYCVKRYLEKLSARQKWNSSGIIIKGGVEGIQMKPDFLTRKLMQQFHRLGEHYAKHEKFDPTLIARLARPHKLSFTRKLFFRLASLLGLTNYYWNMKLKEHEAFENRYDQPYKTVEQSS